jgi:flagella basal body P-ring formation protein FlgA
MKQTIYLTLWLGIACAGVALATHDPTPLLRELAATHLGIDVEHVRVILDSPPGLEGPPDAYVYRFASTPRGRTVVKALSASHRELNFTAQFEIWDRVLVATRTVERGEVLDPAAFTQAEREITRVTPVRPGELETLRASRRIAAGSVLAESLVEPIPLIARGSQVTVVARRGALKVSRKGEALKDAHRGDVVRVRVDRRTIVRATATGPGLCSVEP